MARGVSLSGDLCTCDATVVGYHGIGVLARRTLRSRISTEDTLPARLRRWL